MIPQASLAAALAEKRSDRRIDVLRHIQDCGSISEAARRVGLTQITFATQSSAGAARFVLYDARALPHGRCGRKHAPGLVARLMSLCPPARLRACARCYE